MCPGWLVQTQTCCHPSLDSDPGGCSNIWLSKTEVCGSNFHLQAAAKSLPWPWLKLLVALVHTC